MRYRNTFLTLPIILALASCGGGSDSTLDINPDTTVDDGVDTGEGSNDVEGSEGLEGTFGADNEDNSASGGNIIRTGNLSMGQFISHPFTSEWQLGVSASFGEFESTATQADQVEWLSAPIVEACWVSRSTDEPIPNPLVPGLSFVNKSAGEAITITSPAGTYTTLIRHVDGDSISYRPEAPLTGFPPTGLIADIPGDVVPGYSNVVIPDVAELRLRSPSEGRDFVTSNPVVWDANSDGNSYILITIGYRDAALGGWVLATCAANDDGSFSLPAETISELDLGEANVITQFGISRTAARVETNGPHVLYITNGFAEVFTYF